jgi:hypothetical protein
MSARRIGMGTSVVAGLLVAGIVGVILDIVELPGGSAVGALVGGLTAAWLLHAPRRKTSIAGFLVGVFSLPVQLSIFVTLVSSGLYKLPPAPETAQDVLIVAFVLTVAMQVIGGTAGGFLAGMIRHAPPGVAETPRPYLPPPPPRPEKYCIQCGAGLAKETSVCPDCGAKQPA